MTMCARLRTNIKTIDLQQIFFDLKVKDEVVVNDNLAPTDPASIIAIGQEGLSLVSAGFGLPSKWYGIEKSYPLINARAETVDKLASFKNSFQHRHCLVPVSGFFEWRAEAGKRQPYLFTRKDEQPLLLAGIWDFRKNDTGVAEICFSIITTSANTFMQDYHSRMPVIIDNAEYYDWLESKPNKTLLDPYPSQFMSVEKMPMSINSVKRKSAPLIDSL